jgi:hypothetical protein
VKSQIYDLFNQWLDLMEKAYTLCSKEEFHELEEKIKHEIRFHRRPKVRRKGI